MNRPKPERTKYEILVDRAKRQAPKQQRRKEKRIQEVIQKLDKEVAVWRHVSIAAASTYTVAVSSHFVPMNSPNVAPGTVWYTFNEPSKKSKKCIRSMGRKSRKT